MYFLLVTALFLESFVGYNTQISGDYACEDGEEFDKCRSPCETRCDDIRRGIQNNCSLPCISGCFCRRGLVRADDYTCVPPTECIRPLCGENEEYLECGMPCALNCTNLNSPTFCTKPCYRGCFCKPDFVRDSRGKCIDPINCRVAGNVQCPENEEYVNCVNFCNDCSVRENCRTPYCTPGCDCKVGYFRSTYGQCITEAECIAEEYSLQQQCGVNEVYTSCVHPCNDCYSRGKCDDYLFNYCNPGCDCKTGFFRNDKGICVPEWNCLRETQPICPPGEDYYDCIPTCRVTCDTINTADGICDTTCNRGCFCKREFVRREDGLCVPPSECPAKPFPCPPGEMFYECLPTCRTTCRTWNSSTSTACSGQGCFCQPGFVRNDNGICVAPSECPSVCGPNEEFRTCGSACPASCENIRERIRDICSQQQCLRGCFCKRGFLLGPKGHCIRPRDCPDSKLPVPVTSKPTACCGGLIGRNIGNEEDEDTTPVINTNTPVIKEIPTNESSNVSTSTNTVTTKKVLEEITPIPGAPTTIPPKSNVPSTNPPKSNVPSTNPPKSGVPSTNPSKIEAVTTNPPKTVDAATNPPRTEAATTNPPKSEPATTNPPKTVAATTNPPKTEAAATNPPKTEASTKNPPKTEASTKNPPKTEAAATNPPKTEAATTNPPETEAATTTLKAAATTNTEVPSITAFEIETEPTNSTTNIAETAATVTERQTNRTELTTFANSNTAES